MYRECRALCAGDDSCWRSELWLLRRGGYHRASPESWLNAAPARVVLYRRNLGKSAHDDYELQREVFEAVLWEVMEFLGLDDGHLERLGVMESEDDEDDLHPSSDS